MELAAAKVYQAFRWWGAGTVCLTAFQAIRQTVSLREVFKKEPPYRAARYCTYRDTPSSTVAKGSS